MKDIDPVLEIRAWRDEFARSHGYDLARMSAEMKAYEATLGDRILHIEAPKAVPARPIPKLDSSSTPSVLDPHH